MDLQRMELDTSPGEKSESYSGYFNPLRQEDGHDGKVRSIICRQGCSRDRWLTRDWRRNREAACFRWRCRRIYLFQLGREGEATRERNRCCGRQGTHDQGGYCLCGGNC